MGFQLLAGYLHDITTVGATDGVAWAVPVVRLFGGGVKRKEEYLDLYVAHLVVKMSYVAGQIIVALFKSVFVLSTPTPPHFSILSII